MEVISEEYTTFISWLLFWAQPNEQLLVGMKSAGVNTNTHIRRHMLFL